MSGGAREPAVRSDVGAVDDAGRAFLRGDDSPNQFTSEASRQNSDSSITGARTACGRARWPLSRPEVARSNNSHNSLWYTKRLFERPHRPAVRTRPFQGRDPGSIPGGDANSPLLLEISSNPQKAKQVTAVPIFRGNAGTSGKRAHEASGADHSHSVQAETSRDRQEIRQRSCRDSCHSTSTASTRERTDRRGGRCRRTSCRTTLSALAALHAGIEEALAEVGIWRIAREMRNRSTAELICGDDSRSALKSAS